MTTNETIIQNVIDRLHPTETLNLVSDMVPGLLVRWERKPPPGVDYFSHKLTLRDAIADFNRALIKAVGSAYSTGHWEAGRVAFSIMSSSTLHQAAGLVRVNQSMSYHVAKFISEPR